jgi:hypothetical protein
MRSIVGETRRLTLRYRKLLVRQNVQLKNKIAQLLMESGVSYNKEKLHQQGYFHQVLPANSQSNPRSAHRGRSLHDD